MARAPIRSVYEIGAGHDRVLLACPTVAVAHADDDDSSYLAAIGSVGVSTTSAAAAPSYGRGLCARLQTVGFDPLVAMVHADNLTAGVTMHQAALIIGAATSNYCLDEVDLLPKTLNY